MYWPLTVCSLAAYLNVFIDDNHIMYMRTKDDRRENISRSLQPAGATVGSNVTPGRRG